MRSLPNKTGCKRSLTEFFTLVASVVDGSNAYRARLCREASRFEFRNAPREGLEFYGRPGGVCCHVACRG